MKNIPVANPKVGIEEAQAVYDVIMSGWVSMGPKVQQFEQLLADYAGAKYAVAMNNGTSTLQACLAASILERAMRLSCQPYLISPQQTRSFFKMLLLYFVTQIQIF